MLWIKFKPPPSPFKREDIVSWIGSANGNFKISLAYIVLLVVILKLMILFIKSFGSGMVQTERIGFLLWKIFVNALLTNESRRSRHISMTADCDIDHVFCSLWPELFGTCCFQLIPTLILFQIQPCLWLRSNMLSCKEVDNRKWNTIFVVVLDVI